MFKRWLMPLLLLIGLFGLAVAPAPAQSQDEALAPQVIDVWPLPGVELSADEALTLTFDQAMNPDTTAAAFSLLPDVPGATRWLDARTLQFTPEARWPQQTELLATVAASATSADGVAMDSAYQATLETVGPLLVGTVSPSDEEGAAATDARIVVTFNRPVVALGSTADMAALPSPLTIEPAVDGSGEWVNTSIYSFTPTEALAGSTEYTVTIAPGLESVEGATLTDAYQWTFRTLPPQVLRVSPSAGQDFVPVESAIHVTFSQPMAPASVETAFTLLDNTDSPVIGSFSWNDDFSALSFTPTMELDRESAYTLEVGGSATSANGSASLGEPYTVRFTTEPFPRVVDTTPGDGQTDVDPMWITPSVRFSTPIDFETVVDRIHISPEPESWYPDTYVWEQSRVSLNFTPTELTTYTVTVDAGVEDMDGNVMVEPFEFTFTTGEITPEAYPIINGNFVITNADREDTRLAMLTSGRGSYSVEVYAITPEDVSAVVGANFDNYMGVTPFNDTFTSDQPVWATEDKLIHRVPASFDTQGELRVPEEVLLASDEGGQLAPGLYWISIFSSAGARAVGSHNFQFALAVVDTNVTVKRGPETTVIWLTDLTTGAPVADTPVTVYHAAEAADSQPGEVLATGVTAADGSVTLPVELPETDDVVYVIAESDSAYGAWYSNYSVTLPTERAYLYTDRPIYRPGDTVYFRGVVRDRYDMDYSVPEENSVHVTVRHPWEEDRIYGEMDVPVTAFGTFSGSYDIPDGQPLGDVSIVVDFGDGVSYQYGYLGGVWGMDDRTLVNFTVAEFRPPQYEVSVTPQTETIVQGQTASAVAEAKYYAGGSVNNAQVHYSINGQGGRFDYQGPGNYTFTDTATNDGYFYQDLGSGEMQTDAEGRILLNIEDTLAPLPMPMDITIETTIMDASNQPVSANTHILAHPASVYVGLRSSDGFISAGETAVVDILAVTTDSVPVVGQHVDIEVFEVEWKPVALPSRPGQFHWQEERTQVATGSVTTVEDGMASYTFSPSSSGLYLIRATTRDTHERLNASAMPIYVTGSETVFWGAPGDRMALQADKERYLPSETASILVPLPTDDAWTVLLTTERAGVMTHEVVETNGTTLLYELPLDDSFAPTVYVSATAVRGSTEDDPNPAYATGELRLSVEPVNERLSIEAVPSTTLSEPQGEVSFDLTATNADGKPVQAEIGVALVDKSVLALMPPNSTTLEETFYGEQRNYVVTEVALSGLIDVLTDAVFPGGRGGGGGGGGATPYIREDFEYTPLWAPHVVTDANGQATVSVRLPDNLTTWQLDARAVTLATEVGQTTTEIVSTLPLRVSPVAPRFFVAGDRAELGVLVFNNTGDAQTVDVSLESSGVMLESPQTQTVTIAAGSQVRVDWTVIAQDVPGVDLVFSAMSESGHQDAARPELRTGPDDTIPVYVYSAPDTTGTGGVLREGGATTEAISLPSRLTGAGGELELTLSPSLAAAITDSLEAEDNLPCECTERTVSKLFANAITYQALQVGNAVDSSLMARLSSRINGGVVVLHNRQRPDGSWSWVEGAQTGDPLVTAYAALALVEASEAGFIESSEAIGNAVGYVQADLGNVGPQTPGWQLNRQAFYLYVMSRAGVQDVGTFNALMAERLRMSYAARAYLLLSLSARPDATAAATLMSDLTSAAILSANGAHWEESNPDWYNWGSDTRTTALVLNAIASADPTNPLLPNAVRWLVEARRGDHWTTSQETAWSVMALANWMQITGEMDADYDYETRLNGETLAEAQVAGDTVRDSQTLRVSVANLMHDAANRLTIARTEGQGALYYSTYLDLTLPADEVDAISRGVTVEREYYLNGDRNRRTTEAHVGDVITVRVTLTLPQDIPYFAFEDPIPAGTESIDPRLLTTSGSAQSPRLALQLEDDPFWYFGWWWFDRTELRDASTQLFADFLPRGTYVYTYQLRATLAGEYQVMPAHASALYQPDVFGRTDGSLFTILPNEDTAETE